MSEYYNPGDMVILDGSGISLPLNTVSPLMTAIVDCSQNPPIGYVPYRVYKDDNVIVKRILEGDVLIPEDISGDGLLYNGAGTELIKVLEMSEQFNGCNGYHWRDEWGKYHQVMNCPSHGFKTWGDPPPGVPDYAEFDGWNIWGQTESALLKLISQNAFEYVNINITRDDATLDKVRVFLNPTTLVDIPYVWLSDSKIQIQAYPGYSKYADFGNAKIITKISFMFSVGGGAKNMRREYDPAYHTKTSSIKISVEKCGRFGDYR